MAHVTYAKIQKMQERFSAFCFQHRGAEVVKTAPQARGSVRTHILTCWL
jgi:hypothetical protein